MSSWIGKLAVACAAALMAGSGWASGHREVLRIQCGQGMALAFEARPYDGNMAGSSSVARRYVVHGPGNRVRMAPHLWFERYYANLYHLLPTHPDTLRTTRLRIATDGLAHPGGRFDVADTLYLPPEQFSRIEFETLAACVTGQADSIRQALGEVQIQSRTLLGLMRTHAGFGVNGIARLIHEPVPVAGVYAGSGSQFLLVAHDGTATLRRNYTSNNAMPPPRVVGRVVQGRGKRRTLRRICPCAYFI